MQIRQHTFTLDLLTHDGVCRGALVNDRQYGLTLVWAKQTILCTGGTGQIYRESTNPAVATGDGHAMAYRAGVELRDMEFVQFHPTVLYIAGSSRSLITEAVRGEGACLVDRAGLSLHAGLRLRGPNSAPRDVVAQAIVTQMERTAHPCVYLDMTHLDPQFVRNRFPGIAAKCLEFGIDITTDRIPVRPGAHYMVGGVTVDRRAARRAPACGRPARPRRAVCTGPIGWPRTACWRRWCSVPTPAGPPRSPRPPPTTIFCAVPLANQPVDEPRKALDLADIRNSLTSLMWRDVGVRRTADRMTQALEMIDRWCRYVLVRQFSEPHGWELQNMLTVARLIVGSALGSAGIPRRPPAHRFSRHRQRTLESAPHRAGQAEAELADARRLPLKPVTARASEAEQT